MGPTRGSSIVVMLRADIGLVVAIHLIVAPFNICVGGVKPNSMRATM